MLSDKLILMWNCPNCVKVKTAVDQSLFFKESAGKHGATLTVLHTFSNIATQDIISRFNVDGVAPILITSTGNVISDSDGIINYLKTNYIG